MGSYFLDVQRRIVEEIEAEQIGGDVLKLFKKTLSLNDSSPSFTIERKSEWSCVLSILGLFYISYWRNQKQGLQRSYRAIEFAI